MSTGESSLEAHNNLYPHLGFDSLRFFYLLHAKNLSSLGYFSDRLLDNLGIPYTKVDIDHPEGEPLVIQVNQGRRSVPTLVYGDRATSMSRFSIVKLKTWLDEAGIER